MNKIVDAIIDNNVKRNTMEERVKAGAEEVLSGVTLTSLSNIGEQLKKIGHQFIDEHTKSFFEAADDGVDMAKTIKEQE